MKTFLASAALLTVLAAPAAFAVQPSVIPDLGWVANAPLGAAADTGGDDHFRSEPRNVAQSGEGRVRTIGDQGLAGD